MVNGGVVNVIRRFFRNNFRNRIVYNTQHTYCMERLIKGSRQDHFMQQISGPVKTPYLDTFRAVRIVKNERDRVSFQILYPTIYSNKSFEPLKS